MTEAINLELASRMPWLYAEPESIWEITGSYVNGQDTFTGCLAMVLPFDTTDGHRLFALIHPNLQSTSYTELIPPDRITHARRLVLVHADEPQTAYFEDEQDLVNHERP